MPDTELIYVKTNIGGYFFDGFIDHEHQDDLEITSHPVQNGANVADHAYLKPATLTMHIKMSDVLTDIVPGQFVKDYTRSVSAYNILRELQAQRVPFRVHTRLRAYENMLIKSIVANDDYTTRFGLDCTVTMQEVIVAQTQTVKVSKRQQTTGATDSGVTGLVKVDQSILVQMQNAGFFGGGAQ